VKDIRDIGACLRCQFLKRPVSTHRVENLHCIDLT
jgi:hypothetical protein